MRKVDTLQLETLSPEDLYKTKYAQSTVAGCSIACKACSRAAAHMRVHHDDTCFFLHATIQSMLHCPYEHACR